MTPSTLILLSVVTHSIVFVSGWALRPRPVAKSPVRLPVQTRAAADVARWN